MGDQGKDMRTVLGRLLQSHGSRASRVPLEEAVETVYSSDDPEVRDVALLRIVSILSSSNMRHTALEVAEKLEIPINKLEGFLQVSKAAVSAGDLELAIGVLGETESLVDDLELDRYWLWQRADKLAQVAELYADAGYLPQALSTWEKAATIAVEGQLSGDPQEVVECSAVLSEMVPKAAQRGFHEIAIRIARDIKNRSKRKGALRRLQHMGIEGADDPD